MRVESWVLLIQCFFCSRGSSKRSPQKPSVHHLLSAILLFLFSFLLTLFCISSFKTNVCLCACVYSVCAVPRWWRNATTSWRSMASALWGGGPSLWRGKENYSHIFWREETNKAHLLMAPLSLCPTRWWTVKDHTHADTETLHNCHIQCVIINAERTEESF